MMTRAAWELLLIGNVADKAHVIPSVHSQLIGMGISWLLGTTEIIYHTWEKILYRLIFVVVDLLNI